MKKIIKPFCLIICIFFICITLENKIYADSKYDSLKNGMSSIAETPSGVSKDKGIGKVINIAIGLIQLTGTGISLIVITICGIKYMIASSQEKADLKKQLIPIVIGCVLLFAATNIVGIIADTTNTAGLAGSNK